METDLNSIPLVILAGGKSSRMGISKGLLQHQESPWLSHQIKRFKKIGGKRVILVLGYTKDEYFEECEWLLKHLERWEELEGIKLSVLINKEPFLGPFSSITTAIHWLFGKKDNFRGIFLLPIDVPCPSKGVWSSLAQRNGENTLVSIPRYSDRGGHPVFLTQVFLKSLLKIEHTNPEARLDLQIKKLSKDLIRRVPVEDENILINFNTRSEWEVVRRTL